jgi:hypothetical protein
MRDMAPRKIILAQARADFTSLSGGSLHLKLIKAAFWAVSDYRHIPNANAISPSAPTTMRHQANSAKPCRET